MPSPRSATAVAAVNVPTTTETAVATVGPLNVNMPATEQGILVEATFNFTAGTAATSLTVRIRAGSGITGTVLITHTITVVAGTTYSVSVNALDATFSGAGLSVATYTVSVQQTAATGNGTVNQATLSAEACTAQW